MCNVMDKILKALITLEFAYLQDRVDKDTIEKARGKVAGLGEISVHKDGSKYRKTATGWVPVKGDVDHGRVETKEAHKDGGFSLEINKVGGNQYLHIKHDNTGLTIKNFNSHPIASGQVKLVKEAANSILSKVDWNVKVNQIGDSHKKAVSELDRALELDSNGRYTLSKECLSKIK